jgi:phenylpyruvate tautomerase PptA (4-oxalocrotonate tautomerase family)|tara:strand:- start:1034 stop:1189 length:156 start_codon:yes stop_codon:yes gene_type:complete
MPYVSIKVTKEGVTNKQKSALIKGVTDLLDEVDTGNWGMADEQVTILRKKQ